MPDEPSRIPADRMRRLRAAGEAVALLQEYGIGPTWYADTWWYIPSDVLGRTPRGTIDYVPAPSEEAFRFSDISRQLACDVGPGQP